VDGRRLVSEALSRRAAPNGLTDEERRGADGSSADSLFPDRAVTVIAVGKAAAGMARGAIDILGDAVSRGLVVVPHGTDVDLLEPAGDRIEVVSAGHPIPDNRSLAAGERAGELAREATANEQLLVLLSGGASALMTQPAGDLTLSELQATTDLLLKSGASIDELNTVRKHLDGLKGGGLARLAEPAPVTGLVISDVVGNRLDLIASGPLVPDSSSFEDAVDILKGRDLWLAAAESVRFHLMAGVKSERGMGSASSGSSRAPVATSRFTSNRVDVEIVGDNQIAAAAAVAEAARCGFSGELLTTSLEGEAREVGRQLAALEQKVRTSHQPIPPPACLVAAGETTVTVTGDGIGGRNQELALSAALELAGKNGVLLASMGSDGIDGPTNAAGAWVDGATVRRASSLGISAALALEDNDAYSLFAALDDLIIIGPTGTNVMDLVLLLVE
jgi:hydroxypyruvate reductase